MADTDWGNQTSITKFILLGFGNLPQLQVLLFLLFLVIYIVTTAGNILVVALVVADQHLHTFRYFFLGNLSCLETCYASTLLPRMLASLVTGDRTISVSGCVAQLDFFGSLVAVECCLLSVMFYDRYLEICKPLHYAALMNGRLRFWLAAGSWLEAQPVSFVQTTLVFTSPFCGPNKIDHFFCDVVSVLWLVCADTSCNEMSNITVTVVFLTTPFMLILTSYARIIATVLRMSSPRSRHRAFSTCSSHLVMVTLFYGSGMIIYLHPKSSYMLENDKLLSLFYTVVTPMMNPNIYSLRNEEMKGARRRRVAGKRLSPLQKGFCLRLT
ncbi:olfactory receptor 10A7-like [Chelonia mydas]|uniref:olfactory receptor 10A7-like n=1 Tax=Chelonia mydas TaxID=8469 RepID=UPI0018A20485|nr:olfactory receptor 10A7-like [Chelonia mydas]